jgi:hypothetical protein
MIVIPEKEVSRMAQVKELAETVDVILVGLARLSLVEKGI